MDGLSELDKLRQELARAQQRADEAEQQRERERQRAEEAEQQRERERQRAEEAEQQRERERQRAEEAEQQRQRTTLSEYIRGCHDYLAQTFAVQTDKSLTSKGSITRPQDKRCPARLLPWGEFLELQRDMLGKVYSMYPGQSRDFESLDFLRGLGERMGKRKVGNEKDLEHVQHNAVETPVTSIIEQLQIEDTVRDGLDLGAGIVFENHPNVASDVAEEPQQRLTGQNTPPNIPTGSRPDLNQLRADQICVYKCDEDDPARRRLAYVVEYKAPHKLTLPHLRLGLREVDIYQDIVNRVTKPRAEDVEALFQYHADRLAAAAVVQTFHYMVEGGLEYSYMTTGEAFVFLHIDWADPTTLYFHLAEPLEEFQAHAENSLHCTAVSQVLAFTLLALASPLHGQDEIQRTIESLNVWREDYDSILRAIPETERKQTPSPSAFEPRTYSHFDRSPYIFRSKKKRGRPGACSSGSDLLNREPSPDGSDDEFHMPDSPTQPRTSKRSGTAGRSSLLDRLGSSNQGGQSRPYCTQGCLLGLIHGRPLDNSCPNFSLHRGEQHRDPRYHPVTHETWLRLLHEQLTRTLDNDIVPLGKQGARGILFQVTLSMYGYTIIAKGTVFAFLEDLRHEAAVYQRLQNLQGVCVPVFLGAVDLARPYYYDFRVRVVHVMFLSWAGDDVVDGDVGGDDRRKRSKELVRSVRDVHRAGVVHGDIRAANALWNGEVRRVMLIDFERAVLAESRRLLLSPVRLNLKRKRQTERSWRSFNEDGDVDGSANVLFVDDNNLEIVDLDR
ncbi:hypothetical protein BU26DRAFT_544447 [Trematosphaeria pertusa]|uniref:Protein kinase domain-containing protein n=1 Tax=Trematosphaeria pertusa TaxID=390896 RepID=A0A6A6HTH4_9PLEO|nr:uncharacterized protein BU26DRAFT_544447 [Trematosphaeria pertusa]KAF2241317.1 hypothetical protein BU26DRAFT_544447 [Trematosphaeria pertusa]